MGLQIEALRKAAEGAMYVSDERLCVSAAGELVAEDDPKAVRLLVGKGGSIPAREAAQYGLIADASAPAVLREAAEATAAEPPAADEPPHAGDDAELAPAGAQDDEETPPAPPEGRKPARARKR
jgi:hypothetical protein